MFTRQGKGWVLIPNSSTFTMLYHGVRSNIFAYIFPHSITATCCWKTCLKQIWSTYPTLVRFFYRKRRECNDKKRQNMWLTRGLFVDVGSSFKLASSMESALVFARISNSIAAKPCIVFITNRVWLLDFMKRQNLWSIQRKPLKQRSCGFLTSSIGGLRRLGFSILRAMLLVPK